MKLFNIFAAVGIVSLVAAGCTTTSSNGGTGLGGTGGTGTGGTTTGGSAGTTGTGGTTTGGTGGTTNTGGSAGTTGTGGSAGGGTCAGQTATCQQIGFDQNTDGGTGPCTTCMQANCCTSVNGCFGDAACAGLNDCINKNCSTATSISAVQSCVQTSCPACSPSMNTWLAVIQCLQGSCASQCGVSTDGGI